MEVGMNVPTIQRVMNQHTKIQMDTNGNELTYKNSNGETRGFDKTYTPEEVGYIKRAVHEYWEHWYAEHPENQNANDNNT